MDTFLPPFLPDGPASPKVGPVHAFKNCKMCNRGRVPMNFGDRPIFSQCSYCGAIHISSFGWLVVMEEAVFTTSSPEELKLTLMTVMQSFVQNTVNSLQAFVKSDQMQDLVNTARERYGTRRVPFDKSADWLSLGLSDFRWFKVPQDPMLIHAFKRVQQSTAASSTPGQTGP